MSAEKTGHDALLTPEESVLLLIDHQPFQLVPTILTTTQLLDTPSPTTGTRA